jgi:hypothetical protein
MPTGGPGIQIEVRVEGPIFAGRAGKMIRRATEDTVETAVNFAESHMHGLATMRPRGVFKSPSEAGRAASTGHYRTNIHGRRKGMVGTVHDNKVVYGPWLETGKSNRTTRFKGYHLWRRGHQAIARRIPAIVKIHLARAMGRVG